MGQYVGYTLFPRFGYAWKQVSKGENYRFYGIRCHENERNTHDFPERKVS